jgi:hypothetical protein
MYRTNAQDPTEVEVLHRRVRALERWFRIVRLLLSPVYWWVRRNPTKVTGLSARVTPLEAGDINPWNATILVELFYPTGTRVVYLSRNNTWCLDGCTLSHGDSRAVDASRACAEYTATRAQNVGRARMIGIPQTDSRVYLR